MKTLKLHLKLIKGRWYVSSGAKGYKTFPKFNEILNSWIKGSEAEVLFTSEKLDSSVMKCMLRRNDKGNIVTDFYDIESDNLITSEEQCPKMFSDFEIDSSFYLSCDKW